MDEMITHIGHDLFLDKKALVRVQDYNRLTKMVKVGAMRKDRPIWDAQWVSQDRLSTEQEIKEIEVKEEITDTDTFIKLIKMETKLMKNQRFIATQLPTRKERKQDESK
jgi:hypothetical protein